MTSTYPSRILSITIDRPLEQVYDYIYELKHFPDWATSFCLSIQVAGDEGRMETPEGPAVIRFVERNRWGVLDHWVSVPNGPENYISLRVIPNGAGSELVFTLLQLPGVTDEVFSDDARRVGQDLHSLKMILEAR